MTILVYFAACLDCLLLCPATLHQAHINSQVVQLTLLTIIQAIVLAIVEFNNTSFEQALLFRSACFSLQGFRPHALTIALQSAIILT